MEFVVNGGDSKFQFGTDGLKRIDTTYPAPDMRLKVLMC